MEDLHQQKKYDRLLFEIKSILESQKMRKEKALNMVKVQTYWLIGERICREILRFGERASYGKEVISLLSKDLEFSPTQIKTMISFYRIYPIIQHLSPNLTWSHYTELIAVSDANARRFYEIQTLSNRWSIRELRNRIKKEEHKKAFKKKKGLPPLPKYVPLVYEVIKDTYDFGFLQLPDSFSEQEMEQGLLQHIGQFLMELGHGFSFVGSQYKILIGEQNHRIDLLFFHIPLCCYIIVELKAEKFCDRFIGQMNKYLTYFRERECFPYMKDPLGLIICKEQNYEEVHYALGRLSEEIFVAEYNYLLPKREDLVSHLQKFPPLLAKLTARQRRTIRGLPTEATFSVHDYRKIANVSEATARRDIKDLAQKGVIIRRGYGKKTVYQKNNHQALSV